MSQKNVAAGVFKAQCLSLLEQVARTGQVLVITKYGKPMARVTPLSGTGLEQKSLRGSVLFEGDLVSPIEATWKAAK